MPASNPDEYARLKRIVDGALSLSAERRRVYLDEVCGPDVVLRGEAESLLAATDQAAPLYETPALSLFGSLVMDSLEHDTSGAASPFSVESLAPLFDEFSGTDRYQVLRRIGGGGMGVVYAVHDRLRKQVVALKTLRRRDGRDIYQLKQEFRNLADVAHPNLAALYDLVIGNGQCFFTMELVEGQTFVDYIRQPSSEGPANRARRALPQLIEGIEELHRRGMLHRDIKPSNVLVTSGGRVIILDFGLTSARQRADALTPAGTPAYLSPEQCVGGDPSPAGDWYSVGVTLFQAMTGRLPFEGAEPRQLMARKSTEEAPLLTMFAPDVGPEWEEICAALLRRDPARRMTGAETLIRLGAPESPVSADAVSASVFIGRNAALNVLEMALAKAGQGRSATVMIYGPSGIGKTALVQHFIDSQVTRENVLVFRSRCHEHEAIPYKGLDGIIDGVTQHLTTLAPADVMTLLPEDADALVTLFPVMTVLGLMPTTNADDPIVLRRKAFDAFRHLIENLARRQPLLVDIDDFHWADADSVAWLTALLRPPSLPSLLLLLSFRSSELEAKPFLRALLERVDIGDRLTVALTPMAEDEAKALVTALGQADPEFHAAITHASGGNPFLIEALTRHLAVTAAPGAVTLDEMLTRRIASLPAQASAFLNALALCGRPVLAARIFEACGFSGDERPLVARLRNAHLVRNSRSGERVELYHDRIREVLASRIGQEAARDIHAVLARVLEAHDDDPEALFEHYRVAGHHRLAAAQAAAAGARAAGVLAFDLAATFYRQALALDFDTPHRTEWTVALARALENAGRPVEAADSHLQVARQTQGSEQFEARRKAAELLLIGGQIDRGLAVSNGVLESVGMRLARGPRTAMASLLWQRARLRWRGLEFTAIDASRIAPKDLQAVDACWAISSGLAMVDPLRAAAFNVQQLRRALDVGDPFRVARAMALEAGFSVVGIGAGRHRSEQFSRRAAALATRGGHEYVAALTTLWEGIAAFLTGQWVKASERCGQAATTLRERCTGVTWELNMAHNFFLGGLVAQGELRKAASHLPGLMETARDRGNSYLELELSTRLILAWLASDDPDAAQRQGDACIARWSQRGFQRQHYGHMLMRVQVELYRRRPLHAWRLMEARRQALRRSQFLRVQHTRVESAHFRARCALAMAAAGEHTSQMRAVALHEAERLLRENASWAVPWATLVHATLAYQANDHQLACAQLDQAAQEFAAVDMHLYATICRRRLGTLLGGSEGRALHTQADEWMRAQEIRNPVAMAAVFTPGFPDA